MQFYFGWGSDELLALIATLLENFFFCRDETNILSLRGLRGFLNTLCPTTVTTEIEYLSIDVDTPLVSKVAKGSEGIWEHAGEAGKHISRDIIKWWNRLERPWPAHDMCVFFNIL